MELQNVLIENDGAIQIITVNRPKQLNALNAKTITELGRAFSAADENPEVLAVIITGAGDKAFVAGADIKEFADFNVEQGQAMSAKGQHILFDRVENMNKPVIAAINGFALGGGLELALSAHMRIASENAQLGLPEVTLGIISGYGGTQRLAHLVGKGKAIEMIVSGGKIKAEEAKEWGLVNRVTSQEELMNASKKLATNIIRNAPLAVSAGIRAVLAGYDNSSDGFQTEISEFGKCFGTDDFKEGTTAFMERRKPHFSGK